MLPGKTYRPEDFLLLAWRHWRWIALPVACCITAGVFLANRLPDRFESETVILVVPQRVPESFVRSTVTSGIGERLRTLQQQILSRTKLESVIETFDLYPGLRRLVPMEDVVARMRGDVKVQLVREDSFKVTYTSGDPRTAQRVAERLAGLFIEENLRDRQVLVEGTSQFLDTQLDEARKRLIEHEKRLEQFKRAYAGQLPTQMGPNLQAIQNLQLQTQALVESINRDRDRRLVIDRQLADLEAAAALTLEGPLPVAQEPGKVEGATAQEQLASARATLRALELRLKPQHPDVIRTKRLIDDLEAKVEAEALLRPISPGLPSGRQTAMSEATRQNQIRALTQERENIDRQVAQKEADEARLRVAISRYQAQLDAIPGRESDLTALMRDYGSLQNQYQVLLAKRGDARIAADLERRQSGEQFRLLDPARVPERPVSPNRPLIVLIALVAGVAIGLGIIALLEYRNETLRTDEEATVVLDIPVLSVIPRIETDLERRRNRLARYTVSSALLAFLIFAVGLAVWKIPEFRSLFGVTMFLGRRF